MVLFDNNVLCLLLHPEADVPNDPKTGQPVDRAQDRVNFLRDQLQDAGLRIVIPAPVLSEFLTFADPEYLLTITQSVRFEIAPFDQRAAIESAVALRRALKSGKGKKLGLDSAWQKIKVDRQIIAIGKIYKVTMVYSTDSDVLTLAKESGLEAMHVADLPLPPPEGIQLTLEEWAEASQPSSETVSASQQPSGQSPGDGTVKEPQPHPSLPAAPQADPAPPPQGSSPAAPKPPQTEK